MTAGRAPRRTSPDVPLIPDDVSIDELDMDVQRALRTLPKGLAEEVGRRLVIAGRLLAEDPVTAHAHTLEATRVASRVAAVREACGVTAYAIGDWNQALLELRAARRLSGSYDFLPMEADCERGLGRPERALALAGSDGVARLDKAGRVEMRIVASGARRDLGQLDAAVVTLQCPELKDMGKPWSARLAYAYADALEAVGRRDEAVDWFAKAAAVDPDGETEAAERLQDLEGLVFDELEENDLDDAEVEAEDEVDETAAVEAAGVEPAFNEPPADQLLVGDEQVAGAPMTPAPERGSGMLELVFEEPTSAE